MKQREIMRPKAAKSRRHKRSSFKRRVHRAITGDDGCQADQLDLLTRELREALDRDADTKRKALENGAEDLFTKPIDFLMLRNEIDSRIERAA